MNTWHIENNASVDGMSYKNSRGLNWRLHTKMCIFHFGHFLNCNSDFGQESPAVQIVFIPKLASLFEP